MGDECPTGKCEGISEFITMAQKKYAKDDEWYNQTNILLSKISNKLESIETINKQVADIQTQIHKINIDLKDREIFDLKQKTIDKDSIFSEIRKVATDHKKCLIRNVKEIQIEINENKEKLNKLKLWLILIAVGSGAGINTIFKLFSF